MVAILVEQLLVSFFGRLSLHTAPPQVLGLIASEVQTGSLQVDDVGKWSEAGSSVSAAAAFVHMRAVRSYGEVIDLHDLDSSIVSSPS